mgnify:FL=1
MSQADLSHHVYIIECCDGTLYTGYARNVEERVKTHNEGKGAKYTRGRRPVRLLYSENCASRSAALRREQEIKAKPRAAKLSLIRESGKQGL